jgi:thiamine transporter ThiT
VERAETAQVGWSKLCNYFWGSAAPCASPPPWFSIFSNYSFLVHQFVAMVCLDVLSYRPRD